MKSLLRCFLLFWLLFATVPVIAQVSINLSPSGVYGRIDLGGLPSPQLLYSKPTWGYSAPNNFVPQPIYLHVPPGHAKDWRKHCRLYNACNQPVYFVSDTWYNNIYARRSRGDDERDSHYNNKSSKKPHKEHRKRNDRDD